MVSEAGDGHERQGAFRFPALMSAMMVFMVTLTVTAINLGIHHDFLWQWAKAYVIARPVAGTTAFFALPIARRITGAVWAGSKADPIRAKLKNASIAILNCKSSMRRPQENQAFAAVPDF